MKKSYNVTFVSILQYTGIMFLSNFISEIVVITVFDSFLIPILGDSSILVKTCALVVYILSGFLVPLFAYFLFFRSVVKKQYVPSEGKFHWLKSGARLMLLGEMIRFLFCLSSLGHIATLSGQFSILPTLLFENTYLIWSNRHYEVREWLEYNATDFLAYAVCYIIYLVIYLALVMLLYRHFWKKAAMNDSEALSK